MKKQLLSKTLFALVCCLPILAFSQETKKTDFSLSANYRTANAKANSLLFKDLNGSAEVIEVLFGVSHGDKWIRKLEVGLSFTEFSANTVGVLEESVMHNSVGIRYLEIPILMKTIFNLSGEKEASSLLKPYIAAGINISKHLDTKTSSLYHSEKMSSEGWDAYFRGGFGLIFDFNRNWQASIGFEGVGPIRKKNSLNDKLRPTIEGVYLQLGITYKF